ncbi:MAG: toprim domain-containing protein, partial [Synergistota bacterium]|nr:toprim domain-containing protein [Synergistota bacterium]
MAEKTGKTTKATKKRKKSTTSRKKAVKKGATLVIVESPSKARTLSRILGSGYDIQSSVGHIRDLPKSRMAIDVENDFAPEYILVRGKASIANDLKKRAEASS